MLSTPLLFFLLKLRVLDNCCSQKFHHLKYICPFVRISCPAPFHYFHKLPLCVTSCSISIVYIRQSTIYNIFLHYFIVLGGVIHPKASQKSVEIIAQTVYINFLVQVPIAVLFGCSIIAINFPVSIPTIPFMLFIIKHNFCSIKVVQLYTAISSMKELTRLYIIVHYHAPFVAMQICNRLRHCKCHLQLLCHCKLVLRVDILFVVQLFLTDVT
mmetsp:Transcript_2330/g.3430  ORF Transcript_2330/g.3430 Transcript_2330/m.3430 type:complete len:213 (-) Transcript_2330:608-1246(-)